ncbi:hypothetical protein C8R46DRAFT_1207484 [Mycena filopes]|nr:hypothetical protein C8R46DRAFT_1224290 [Mycena filopes]KAJ7160126.1 hypothetical protein C8R46DRAFT_1223624 [Mycena filopes]KAJ7185308.1 hypothetical protein C8R46DRAFT_1207484 [Mycena filopes]
MASQASVDSGWGPAGVCIAGTNRSEKYFYTDGSMFLRAEGSNAIYCVWGSRLSKFSEFFRDLLSLPLVPNEPAAAVEEPVAAVEEAKTPDDIKLNPETSEDIEPTETKGDGKSESAPLCIQISAKAFEVLLECLFSELGELVLKTRPIAFWALALEAADFLGSPVVTQIATQYLGARLDFHPALRLQLAIRYYIQAWIEPAFLLLIRVPLQSFTTQERLHMGFAAYTILAETHAKITEHRTLCALTVPPVEHCKGCISAGRSDGCNKSWAHAWWGESVKYGVAVALIHPNHIPAAKIIRQLDTIVTSYHMDDLCRKATIYSLTKPGGLLLKEEKLFRTAIAQLKLVRA